jgi:hypothetical protein
MPKADASDSTSQGAARREALRAIAGRLASEKEELARRVVDGFRREIVDYRAPSDEQLLDDALSFSVGNVEALVDAVQNEESRLDEHLKRARELAARRVHQGVPLEALLRAVRMWGSVCWDAVLEAARADEPQEREAALEIAGHVGRLVDRLSTAITHGYLDEVTDRGLLRRDLLDALLTGIDSDGTHRLAQMLHLRLGDSYVVVVVHGAGIEFELTPDQPPATHSGLDRIVDEIRRNVLPSTGTLLAGMRNGDLVVLYPTSVPSDLETVREDCEALATALGAGVSIGMSGWHQGRAMVPIAYAEARGAVEIASRTGIHGRAVGLDEVLVEHMLDSSVPAQRILDETLRPLIDYDAARHAALVPTLRAYLDARFNITKTAAALFVNPNTVVYRLRRIKELSGRDLHDFNDLLVLSLALKLNGLRSRG